MLLADHLIEGLGAVAAIERGLAGHRAESTVVPGAFPRSAKLLAVSTEDILNHGQRIAALERKVAELYKRIGEAEPGFGGGSGFASDQPASLSASEDPQVLELIQTGQKIEAIKRYRELTGVGLAEAKDAVERVEQGYG